MGGLFQERKSDESMCTFVCHVLTYSYTLLVMFVLCILHAWSHVSRGIVMSFKHPNDGFSLPIHLYLHVKCVKYIYNVYTYTINTSLKYSNCTVVQL